MIRSHGLLERLRQRGYRVTPQREMIVEAVAESCNHLTAEEIFEAVHSRSRAINVATVYRTLDFLVKEGLASRSDLGGGRIVYATTQHGPHIHLVCRLCGQVIEASYELVASLEQRLAEQYGFTADLSHLAIAGLCPGCRHTS